MIRCFLLLLYAYTVLGIGLDSGGGDRATCGRPYRSGRVYQPPCDVSHLGYCTQAGQLYPWGAVKRFVEDNQGLMRRMYGDQRHGRVLKAELNDGDAFEEEWEKREKERGDYGIWRPTPERFARYQHRDKDIENEVDDMELDSDDEEPRYLQGDLANDDVLNTKFVISEQEASVAIKLAELKAAHFRPVHHRAQYTTTTTKTTPKTPITNTTPKATTRPTTSHPTATTTTISTTKRTPSKPKRGNVTFKTKTNEVLDGEDKWRSTRATTETSSIEPTEEILATTASTTTTLTIAEDDDHSTTDITTEWTPTKSTITSTRATTASDRLLETTESKEDMIGAESSDKKSVESLKNSNDDQLAESSENGEIYSDSEGNVKRTDGAMLFQDMEVNSPKKKGPVDYEKMNGVNACPVKEEVVAPFWANNTRGEVLALLNMYPFEQYVHWEKCTFEHKQMYCREGCRCEQQYRLHRLLAYDPGNECRGIFSDWFRFPSCCVCKCYDMPPEFRVTSRSPRFHLTFPEDDE